MAVIGGTVFVIKEVEINFISAESFTNEEESKENMLSKIDYLKGKSILFNVNENEIRSKIESAEKLIKVKNIKAEFPNKIIIDVRERFPVYKYTFMGTTMILDTEMRILYKDPNAWKDESELTDISDAGISLNPADVGDFATGATAVSIKKIEQLNIVSNYFSAQGTQEAGRTHMLRKITFDDDNSASDMLRMVIEMKPQSVLADTKITIITQGDEDFARLLAFVWATVENPLIYDGGIKAANLAGWYSIDYDESGKIVVGFDEGKDGEWDAIFRE
jgi:transcriptional regulator of acetoin/glycerol metabolism